MSSLAWFVAAIIAACALCTAGAGAAAYSRRSNATVWFKRAATLYAMLIAFLLVGMIHHFIGWDARSSLTAPKHLQRRIQHTGYYFAPDRELRLNGKASIRQAQLDSLTKPGETEEERAYETEVIRQLLPSEPDEDEGGNPQEKAEVPAATVADEGFVHGSLEPGESIALKPVWKGDRAEQWTLKYKVSSRPLRLKSVENDEEISRCVNVPEDRWLDRDDAILLTSESEGKTHFISIKWGTAEKYWWPFTRKYETYHYGQGVVRADGALEYEKGPDLLMSERTLSDAIPLSNLIRRGRKEFREQVGSIRQEWWGVLGDVMLVREVRGRSDSRVGVLVDNDLFTQPGLKIYRLHGGGFSQLWTARDAEEARAIPASMVVAYGVQGQRNSFELVLSNQTIDDDTWGQVVQVKFSQPKAWVLPPSQGEDFIITSSNDYIPLDGYFLDIGNSPHSFYAKARLDDDLDGLSINDGRNVVRGGGPSQGAAGADRASDARRFGLGEDASLGDYEQGVMVVLAATQAGGEFASVMTHYFGAPYIGLAASALIALNFGAFLLIVLGQRSYRPRLLLAWALIWGVTLTMLSVRLVLAYRVSLVPPLDASLGELNIFHKGVDYALGGLGLFALLTLTLWLAPGRPVQPWRGGRLGPTITRLWRVRHRSWFTPACVIVWALLIVGYTLAGWLLGTNQSFGGVRISIADHVLIIVGLALLARRVLDYPRPWLRPLLAGFLLLALALQIVVIKDAGAVIYAYSLLLCVSILLTWRKPARTLWDRVSDFVWRRRRLRQPLSRIPARARRRAGGMFKWLIRLAPVSLPLAALAALFVMPYLIRAGWTRNVVQPHLPETTFYRFVSFTDSEDVILTTKGGEEATDMSKLLDNSQQDWQMLLYASHGASEPVGYGRAPLSKVGMTYATSVSDCAFATYLLSEHGRWAALFLLLLYCLLACACVLGAWHFDDNSRHRALPLIAIGAYFACNALYMAGANTGLSVFTGQNLPLLGLNSGGDLFQGLLLSWLVSWLLLATAHEGTPRDLRRRHPVVLWTSLLLFALLPFWLAAVGWQMRRIGADENYRKDHNFKPETLDRLEKDLPPENSAPERRGSPLVLNGERIEQGEGQQLTEIEKQYIKQFNDRMDKFNPNSGLYYLERPRGVAGGGEARIRINRRYFTARSPFDRLLLWRGSIMAAGESDPTIYKLNTRMKISLQAGGEAGTVDIDESQPALTNSSVSLKGRGNHFCELRRDGDRVRLDPHMENQWDVYVDGKKLTAPTDLAPLSIVVVEQRENRYRRNLIYLGMTKPVLAYVRWRNGEQRRMFPESGFSLAYMLGKAADRAFEMESKLPESERRLGNMLTLNLDVKLHQSLQKILGAYAAANANYSALLQRPNRLAVTVINPFSGSVLALPSWPQLDPGKPDYETLIDKIPEPARSRFEDNHNLSAHVVGSTIKPVVLATMGTSLRQAGYELAKMKIVDREDPYVASPNDDEPPVHPHLSVNGVKIKLWDCNGSNGASTMADFIIHSRDFPEGVLGMLGMLTNERELVRVRAPNNAAPALIYDGKGYSLDMTRASESATAFTLKDQRNGGLPAMRGAEIVNQTILFRGLASLFNFTSSGPRDFRLQRACENFSPSLCNPGLMLSNNDYLDNVLAMRLAMGDGDFQDIRHGLISCLLGGGDECDFNNVMMAEAGARLATGSRVFARLEDKPSQVPAEPLLGPLGDAGWRLANIVTPMQMAGEIGTAKDMRGLVKLPAQYKAIYKTGTIVEGIKGRESEALMFVIGKWENGSFVTGKALAGFLYMERSKVRNPPGKILPDGDMKKFKFAAPFLNTLVKYLETPRRTN